MCRYEYFFLEPVAHTLLYGVIKQFWAIVLRDEAAPDDADYWVPKAAREEMRKRLSSMELHGSLTAVFANVVYACT